MGLLQSQKNQAKDAFGEDDLEGVFKLEFPAKLLVKLYHLLYLR